MIKKNTQKLKKILLSLLEEHKGENSVLLDISELTNIADFMILVSGTSTPHLKALASRIIAEAKIAGFKPIGTSGTPESGWVLIDLGDIIIHIMLPEIREFYALEELWDKGFVRKEKKPIKKNSKTKTRKV